MRPALLPIGEPVTGPEPLSTIDAPPGDDLPLPAEQGPQGMDSLEDSFLASPSCLVSGMRFLRSGVLPRTPSPQSAPETPHGPRLLPQHCTGASGPISTRNRLIRWNRALETAGAPPPRSGSTGASSLSVPRTTLRFSAIAGPRAPARRDGPEKRHRYFPARAVRTRFRGMSLLSP